VRASDFEIHNYTKLDKILLKLCEMVIDEHHSEPKLDGLVGAAVLDPKNNIVTGISTKSGDKWIHAEREALSKYESKYGEVPEGSIIVTTLSPCNDKMDNRYSESCTDLINNSPVKKVYCGYIDPTQTNDQRKFTQLESGNKSVRELCKKISNIFLEKKDDFIKETQELDEMPLPTGWDENELSSAKSFKSRLAYALQRAKRLGGGSARVAMIIEYEGRPTALKVAKNAKGMAQNQAEVNVLDDGYLGRLPIVIPLIDYDRKNPQPTWLQTELAKKVSSAKLATLLHCTHVWDFTEAVEALLNRKDRWRGRELGEILQDLKEAGKTEQDLDIFMDYVHEAGDLINSSTILIGDLNQAANWGEYDGRPVILDLGFTEEVMPLYQRKVKRGWG